jgi:phage tail-like protein
MPTTKDEIKARYPLPAYNYRVKIGALSLGVAEVSGLNIRYDVVTYRHGLSFASGVKLIPGMPQQITLTLKRGVCQKDAAFYSWFRETYTNPFTSLESQALANFLRESYGNALVSHQRDVLIDLCDEVGQPLVRWKVLGAIPVRIDAPSFSATSNEVAIETIELVAQAVQVEYL